MSGDRLGESHMVTNDMGSYQGRVQGLYQPTKENVNFNWSLR